MRIASGDAWVSTYHCHRASTSRAPGGSALLSRTVVVWPAGSCTVSTRWVASQDGGPLPSASCSRSGMSSGHGPANGIVVTESIGHSGDCRAGATDYGTIGLRWLRYDS